MKITKTCNHLNTLFKMCDPFNIKDDIYLCKECGTIVKDDISKGSIVIPVIDSSILDKVLIILNVFGNDTYIKRIKRVMPKYRYIEKNQRKRAHT